MTDAPRSPRPRMAPALLAGLLLLAAAIAAPASAQSAGTTTTSNSSTTTTTTTVPDSTTTTSTLPQIGQGPLPGSPPPSTTVPPPAATVPPEQVQSLLTALNGDLAQIAALDAYRRDQIVAVNAATQAASTDAVVAQSQQAVATATATREAAVQAVGSNVRDLAGLAIALYLHEDVASQTLPDSYNGTIEDRQVMLSILLDGGQDKVKTSRQDASAAANAVRDAANRFAQAQAAQALAHRAEDEANAVLIADKAAALGQPAKTPAHRKAVVKPPPAPPSPNVAGPSVLTAGELAGWFASTGHQTNVGVPMEELATDYIDAGQNEGVESDVAFAQSVIETGYFAFPAGGQLVGTDNNFAGIGACDSCTHGWTFPDARTGVAAQIQLLHAYASPAPVATPLVGKVFVAGCCRTWMALTGVWATAPTYGFVVLSLYRQMLDWALPRRLATAGLTTAPTR
jgi:hypothetical protein